MAVSRIERMILKTMIYGSLVFDPQALDPEIESDVPSKMVRNQFGLLSTEVKKPLYDYFRAKPRLPFQFYRKSGCNGKNLQDYKIHYEYDRADRRTEAMRLVLAGFDLTKLRGEYYTFAQLHELRRAYESGVDITPLLDNRYSRFQLKVIVPAIRRGYDVTNLLDPAIPAREMAAMYYATYERVLLEDLENQGIRKQLHALGAFDEIEQAQREMQKEQEPRKPSLDDTIRDAQDVFQQRRDETRDGPAPKIQKLPDDKDKVVDITKYWAEKSFGGR